MQLLDVWKLLLLLIPHSLASEHVHCAGILFWILLDYYLASCLEECPVMTLSV